MASIQLHMPYANEGKTKQNKRNAGKKERTLTQLWWCLWVCVWVGCFTQNRLHPFCHSFVYSALDDKKRRKKCKYCTLASFFFFAMARPTDHVLSSKWWMRNKTDKSKNLYFLRKNSQTVKEALSYTQRSAGKHKSHVCCVSDERTIDKKSWANYAQNST